MRFSTQSKALNNADRTLIRSVQPREDSMKSD
jgi:hypothetical protein